MAEEPLLSNAWMPDRWERMARASAMDCRPCDYGSTRAIHDVARLLRIAYDLGRAEALLDG